MGDEAKQVSALHEIGLGIEEAHRVAALAPQALARAVIEDIADVKWSSRIAVGEKEFQLNRQPEYGALLALARLHRRHGFFDQSSFKAIAESSSEVDVVSNALNEGGDTEGSVIASCLLYGPFAEYFLD